MIIGKERSVVANVDCEMASVQLVGEFEMQMELEIEIEIFHCNAYEQNPHNRQIHVQWV